MSSDTKPSSSVRRTEPATKPADDPAKLKVVSARHYARWAAASP